MNVHPTGRRRAALFTLAAGTVLAIAAGARSTAQTQKPEPPVQQVVKPPIAQLWMDIATVSSPGMGGMAGMMGAMPGFGGGGGGGGLFGMGSGGSNAFGNTRGQSPGRFVDLALHTQRKPQGTEGAQAMPEVAGLPPSVKLLPLVQEKSARRDTRRDNERYTEDEDPQYEQPRGRVLLYWGCGDTVRAGQPRIIDFAKSSPAEWGSFMQGRAPRERGAVARPGRALWPNDKDRRAFPAKASLVGQHTVTGEGVPEGMKFTLGAGQEFMPEIALKQSGSTSGVLRLSWNAIPQAQGFFINAMGARENEDGSTDMIFWSSADVPEVGMNLIEYASPGNIAQWLKDKVVLPGSTTSCPIPKAAFDGAEGGMLRMVAYGPELNVAYPARPTDPKIPWEPEWAVRVRNKSTLSTFIGESEGGEDMSGEGAVAEGKPDCPKPEESEGGSGLGGLASGLGKVMGGFGGLLGGKEKKKQAPPDGCGP
jgi:hypothetical protein